jgi:putative two-component system response regulator
VRLSARAHPCARAPAALVIFGMFFPPPHGERLAAATRMEHSPESVLVVDDETGVRELVARWLAGGGYDVRTAANADEALDRVHDRPPAVALCDIRMPGHDGLWLANQIRHEAPETAVIMATGIQDVSSAVTSLRQGVIDYLTKPFGRDRVRESVLRGLEWHKAAWDSRRWRETLQREVDIKRERLSDALGALTIDSDHALDGLLAVLTLADREAYAHAYRVVALAASVACAMNLEPEEATAIERAALLHDVGKLSVPNSILDKPGPLTGDEWDVVRLHPYYTQRILSHIRGFEQLARVAAAHHERLDGRGYYLGLMADEISLESRILAVADVFDALTASRPYRPALPEEVALRMMERDRGHGLCPDCLDALWQDQQDQQEPPAVDDDTVEEHRQAA